MESVSDMQCMVRVNILFRSSLRNDDFLSCIQDEMQSFLKVGWRNDKAEGAKASAED